MQVIKSPNQEDGIEDLSSRLNQSLNEGKRILWLISGGSNINAACEIMRRVPDNHSDQLIISLIDERYGEPGHQDSNFQQLLIAGFNKKRAQLVPVLYKGLSLEDTASKYEEFLADATNNVDTSIGLLGIGDDCHIAGILPNSNAATEKESLVAAYNGGQYQRITTTFQLLEKLTICYAFAFGDNKNQALTEVIEGKHSIVEKPALILRELNESYLYSDQVGNTKDGN